MMLFKMIGYCLVYVLIAPLCPFPIEHLGWPKVAWGGVHGNSLEKA